MFIIDNEPNSSILSLLLWSRGKAKIKGKGRGRGPTSGSSIWWRWSLVRAIGQAEKGQLFLHLFLKYIYAYVNKSILKLNICVRQSVSVLLHYNCKVNVRCIP